MAPEIEGQEVEPFQQIVPEASQESIDDFIKSLETDFEYPALSALGRTDAEIADEIVDPPEEPNDEEDNDTPPEVPPVDEGQSQPPASDTPPSLPADHVLVNGIPVALADLQRLHEFDQFLRNNPDAAARVQAAVQPPVPPSTETPAPANQEVALTPPEFLDLEDPAQKFMWDSYVAQQKQIEAISARDVARDTAAAQAKINSEMDQALLQWKTAHPNFNEDQINSVRRHAADMNVIDSLIATTPSPVAALVRAMDLAALDDPDLRTVYLTPETPPTPTRHQRSTTRKGKLNSLGGGSGSVPRTTTTPRAQSDREAIDQFAKELGESFQNQ